jgi:hypothetical protein
MSWLGSRGRDVRHPGESRDLVETPVTSCPEVPAFAGMTVIR